MVAATLPPPHTDSIVADLVELAGEHSGRMVATEWHGSLGWTRFLGCKRWAGPRAGSDDPAS